ncbi:hypothetical protein [uncultured Sphingomonas sp.]|uniref:hypothetical protein n=1 Tax=uncultured Sphingomonas sp. TaxID=158754 RepID=UPI0025E16055|nr:hypothetical protein [uncultured Sphingomonas sp.]
MQMPRLNRSVLPGRARANRGTLAAIELKGLRQNMAPARDDSAFGPRQLLAALDGLSAAVIEATGSWAFLTAERIQLIDAAHKLAWLLVRVNRSEAMIARSPDLAGTTRAIIAATYTLRAVQELGEGAEAIQPLFDLIVRIDQLLPRTAQLYQ